MSEIDDLIKLNELREKNILTREEFEEQKAKLLGTSGQTDKEGGLSSQSAGNTTDKGSKADKACLNTEEKTVNRVMYIILGIFFGLFGIHNFYAGYKGRGIAKILLSILIVPILFVELWVLIELVATKTDGKGRLMEESATPVRILPIIFLIIYSLSLFFIVFVGGMAGYSSARRRIAENRALDDLMLAVVNVREISSGGNYENIENIAAQIGLLDNLKWTKYWIDCLVENLDSSEQIRLCVDYLYELQKIEEKDNDWVIENCYGIIAKGYAKLGEQSKADEYYKVSEELDKQNEEKLSIF